MSHVHVLWNHYLIEKRFMNDFNQININTNGALQASPLESSQRNGSLNGHAPAEINSATRPSDRLELSDRALLLSHLRELPDVRTDVVDRVRAQIADTDYPTDETLDIALDNLAADIL